MNCGGKLGALSDGSKFVDVALLRLLQLLLLLFDLRPITSIWVVETNCFRLLGLLSDEFISDRGIVGIKGTLDESLRGSVSLIAVGHCC